MGSCTRSPPLYLKRHGVKTTLPVRLSVLRPGCAPWCTFCVSSARTVRRPILQSSEMLSMNFRDWCGARRGATLEWSRYSVSLPARVLLVCGRAGRCQSCADSTHPAGCGHWVAGEDELAAKFSKLLAALVLEVLEAWKKVENQVRGPAPLRVPPPP